MRSEERCSPKRTDTRAIVGTVRDAHLFFLRYNLYIYTIQTMRMGAREFDTPAINTEVRATLDQFLEAISHREFWSSTYLPD